MPERLDYLRDGGRIYERSFAIIRAEADLSRFSAEEADVAVRMVHACGCVEVTRRIVFGEGLVGAARAALARACLHKTRWFARCTIRAWRGSPKSFTPPARPPRSTCGKIASAAHW